jgi:two-component system, cell cycle sensor histidine kinase and response regulator CckA
VLSLIGAGQGHFLAIHRKTLGTGLSMTAARFQWADFIGDAEAPRAHSRAGEEVATLRSMLHHLFEEVPVGLFTVDNRSGRFLLVNREFERITGYSRHELLESTFIRVVAPEDIERVREYRRRRMRRDPTLPKRYEMLLITRSGDRRAVAFDATPIPFTDVISGAIRDITNEKIHRDPVVHLQRLDGLASLASGLANEFNNLLSAIAGYADLALSSTPPETKIGSMLGKIKGASHKALRHVRDLSAFARSGSNAMESVDLGSLVGALTGVLDCTAPTKRFTVTSQAPPEVCATRGDVAQLEQAILNIALNAIDSLPAKGGTISIDLELVEIARMEQGGLPLGVYVRIVVSDNGHGIAEEDLERVFQPFFTRRQSSQHTGLGLSTAYGIIRDHGGSLSVRSKAGSGTKVSILLPLDAGPEQLVPARLEEPREDVTSSSTIVIIDDQEFVNELFRDVLEGCGYEVRSFTAAAKALAAIRGRTVIPDLVIVDLMMPQMDGRTFIREARSSGMRSPILVTSGFSTAEEGDQVLRGETCGFLRKPFRPAELRNMVGNALSENLGAREKRS